MQIAKGRCFDFDSMTILNIFVSPNLDMSIETECQNFSKHLNVIGQINNLGSDNNVINIPLYTFYFITNWNSSKMKCFSMKYIHDKLLKFHIINDYFFDNIMSQLKDEKGDNE